MTKESAIININQRMIFFLLSCLGICCSSYFKQIHKLSLYPTQCSSQESSKTMSAKSFVLISMAVDPVLNLQNLAVDSVIHFVNNCGQPDKALCTLIL